VQGVHLIAPQSQTKELEHQMVKNVQEPAERVVANVERVIVGKHVEVRMALVALLCEGHILIEDVPGVGKTMLAKALSKSIGCSFRRIQFTPDLLPSDVTGLSIFNQKTQEFEFRPGPIMAQVVLADEINRATPKTQSALLECMEERQATIDAVEVEDIAKIAHSAMLHGDPIVLTPEQIKEFQAIYRTSYGQKEDMSVR
jgi:MoxR-like ATPase